MGKKLSDSEKKQFYNEIKQIVESKGGKMISTEYISSITKMVVECENGHQWEITSSSLKYDKYCSYCKRGFDHLFRYNKVKQIVESKGGKMISTEYISSITKMVVECKNGHQWEITAAKILMGKWCMHCHHHHSSNNRYQRLKASIESKGGKLISKEYFGDDKYMTVECENGHQWEVIPKHIRRGNWCSQCRYNNLIKQEDIICSIEKKGDHYSTLKKIIKSKGGKLISSRKDNKKTKLFKIECENGHQWETYAHRIYHGQWCTYCSHYTRDKDYHYELIKELIMSKGWKLISKEYLGAIKPITVECENGHQWESTPNRIGCDCCCPICHKNLHNMTHHLRKKTIIESKGWKFIRLFRDSDKIKKYRVECESGHRQELKVVEIQRTMMCPFCHS